MVFSFWIGVFSNLPLILHKVEQKDPANYPLQVFHIPHFTLHFAEKFRKLSVADFPHHAFYHLIIQMFLDRSGYSTV